MLMLTSGFVTCELRELAQPQSFASMLPTFNSNRFTVFPQHRQHQIFQLLYSTPKANSGLELVSLHCLISVTALSDKPILRTDPNLDWLTRTDVLLCGRDANRTDLGPDVYSYGHTSCTHPDQVWLDRWGRATCSKIKFCSCVQSHIDSQENTRCYIREVETFEKTQISLEDQLALGHFPYTYVKLPSGQFQWFFLISLSYQNWENPEPTPYDDSFRMNKVSSDAIIGRLFKMFYWNMTVWSMLSKCQLQICWNFPGQTFYMPCCSQHCKEIFDHKSLVGEVKRLHRRVLELSIMISF